MEISFLKELISCSRGEIPSDILIRNGTMVNVLTREVYKADIAVYKDRIANVSEPNILTPENSRKVIDADRKLVSPGFIETHLHIESSMLPPTEFSKLVIPHGTTTVLMDPHEIGNVLGVEGLQLLLDLSENQPVRFLIEIPSCVPAAPGLETTGFTIDDKTISRLISEEPRYYGLGEVMNYPGVLFKDESVLNKILSGKNLSVIDGHSPGVSGRDLDAYIATGIRSDHESTSEKELLEKLRKGMTVMVREGSFAKDLKNILQGVKDKNIDLRNCTLCSDDRNVLDLVSNGHMNSHLRLAVKLGIDPIEALQMVTINAATYLKMQDDIGSISPGKIADLILIDDLQNFNISTVISRGVLVYTNNSMNWNFPPTSYPLWAVDTIKLPDEISTEKLKAKTSLAGGYYPVKVIGVIPNSLVTESKIFNLKVENGWIHPSNDSDVLSISVIERYGVNGNISNGFINGFGIKSKNFAMATTVAHDSHNLLVVGTNPEVMIDAIRSLERIKGGYVVIADGKTGTVRLPFGGLMSINPYNELHKELKELNQIFHDGVTDFEEPLMALSFMALPVIPHLKITDKGLVDVDKFAFTDLITEER
ncbi:MAG: adenine deaminase [Candidatus Hodarchaeales archaeon]|jgi:adenine deaminase